MAFSYKGFSDCVRADDGRPVCISEATGGYHFVTEQFLGEYQQQRSRPSVSFSPAAAGAPTIADVYAMASQSVVLIVTAAHGTPVGLGSGVVIGHETVVTNCHVLRGAQEAGVLYNDAIYDRVRVTKSAIERDLCIIEALGLPAPSIVLGSTDGIRVGQRVLAIGNPQGLDLTLSEGLVSSLRSDPLERYPLIQTSAAISSGSSGGALLTERGVLIGITTLQFVNGQNLNFAVPVDWVRELQNE